MRDGNGKLINGEIYREMFEQSFYGGRGNSWFDCFDEDFGARRLGDEKAVKAWKRMTQVAR